MRILKRCIILTLVIHCYDLKLRELYPVIPLNNLEMMQLTFVPFQHNYDLSPNQNLKKKLDYKVFIAIYCPGVELLWIPIPLFVQDPFDNSVASYAVGQMALSKATWIRIEFDSFAKIIIDKLIVPIRIGRQHHNLHYEVIIKYTL